MQNWHENYHFDANLLQETLTFNVKDLSKFFETGDHVKVVSGTQEGATGMVTKVEGRVLVIVSDASMEEVIHNFLEFSRREN